jgi:hypothetical protein
MAEHLGHKRLKVYQKGMPFASMRETLLDDLTRRVAAYSDNAQRRSGMTSSSHTSSHTCSHTLSSTLRRTLRRLFPFGGLEEISGTGNLCLMFLPFASERL